MAASEVILYGMIDLKVVQVYSIGAAENGCPDFFAILRI